MRSGDVPVLATPRVIALCEEAACAAVAAALEPGSTSVGTWIELEHLSPSPIGAEVVAKLTHADGCRREFELPGSTPHLRLADSPCERPRPWRGSPAVPRL
jgi:fluoroacetyl-CoA thioesterase